jgi:hypothetical protein
MKTTGVLALLLLGACSSTSYTRNGSIMETVGLRAPLAVCSRTASAGYFLRSPMLRQLQSACSGLGRI